MSGDDFVELVWENGQILMRDRLGRTFKVREWRSRYALYPSNAQAEDGGNMHRKRGSLEKTYSTLKDSTSLDCRDSHDLNYFSDYDHDSLTGYHSESSPDLDQQLNLEANRSKTSDDKNSTHPRINIPGPDDANFKPSNASMFVGRLIPDQLATSRNCHLEPSSFHFQELDTLLGPREKNPSRTPESILAGLHTSNSLEHDLNPNTKTGTVMNFSYLRPEALLKASTPVFTRVQEVKSSNDERPPLGSRDPRESTIIGQASGSKRSATGPENQPEKELIPPVAETQDQSLPHDQHSEAFCRIRINLHNSHDQLPDQTSSASAANTPKGKPAVTSSSVCSLEASNDPTYSLRTYEDHTEESEYHLSPPISSALRSCPTLRQKVGEPECFKKQAPARSCGGCKRSSRTTEVHSLSEKRRREKVKEKMRVLKELIPNCDKVDKVSMLDEAIEYLKTLQLQLQIMSMGNNGAYNMPSIMLPAGMQHFMMNAVPHLTYFSPNMGAGMYVGMGCSPLYSPTSQIGATALPGITGNNIQLMHGFQGQPFPMPVSDASFLPSLGRLSAQSVQSGTAWPLSSLQDCSLTRPRDQKQECFV